MTAQNAVATDTVQGLLDLANTKNTDLVSRADYDAMFAERKAYWDNYMVERQAYFQTHTNSDINAMKDVNVHVSHKPEVESDLDAWFASDAGQNSLTDLSTKCVAWLNMNGDSGVPGHDRRHVMFKDVAEGRRFLDMDGIDGHKLGFLIGSLMHDSGRLLEERLSGTTLSGVAGADHAYWSADIVKHVLDSMGDEAPPVEVQDDILMSIIAHQAGKTPWHFASQAVQRGDRVGGLASIELPARALQMDTGELGLGIGVVSGSLQSHYIGLPGLAGDTDLISHIEFYGRHLFPNVGTDNDAESHMQRARNIAYVMLASSLEENEVRFTLELARASGATVEKPEIDPALADKKYMPKKILDQDIWDMAIANVAAARSQPDVALSDEGVRANLRLTVEHALTRAGSNLTAHGIATVADKLDELTPDQARRFLTAMTFVESQRDLQDKLDVETLARPAKYAFVNTISRAALGVAELGATVLPNREAFYGVVAPVRKLQPVAKPAVDGTQPA